MRKGLSLLLVGVFLVYGNSVLAREGEVGDPVGPGGTGRANPGGMASEHIGHEARENTNAQWSSGATRGQERSETRRHEGKRHGKSRDGHRNHGQGKHQERQGRGNGKGGSDNKAKGNKE